jgi:hypothetical protein
MKERRERGKREKTYLFMGKGSCKDQKRWILLSQLYPLSRRSNEISCKGGKLTSVVVFDEDGPFLLFLVLLDSLWVDLAFLDHPRAEFLLIVGSKEKRVSVRAIERRGNRKKRKRSETYAFFLLSTKRPEEILYQPSKKVINGLK